MNQNYTLKSKPHGRVFVRASETELEKAIDFKSYFLENSK